MAVCICEYCSAEFEPKPGYSLRFCCKLHRERAGIRRWRATHREARNAAERRARIARKACLAVANPGDK